MRLPILALMSIVALKPVAHAADLETNKQLYRNYIENVINHRHIEETSKYFGVDFIEHNRNLASGLAGKKSFVASVLAGFSDYHGEIEQIVAEGDRIAVRILWTGTQDGPFLGRPPTGRKVRFATADFFRIQDGKLAEHWDVVDSLPRAIALGLVTGPTTSTRIVPKD